VNEWSGVFLGIIAVATLVMALIQVGAIIALLRVAKQAQAAIATLQRDVTPLLADARPLLAEARPIVARANEIASEASRTMAIATAQAQKVDGLVTDLARRVDETSLLVQQAIVTPAREGIAIVAAIKAAFGVLRRSGDFRGRTGRHGDEEDPLFIG
jgi:uncharacterized protein YoxC